MAIRKYYTTDLATIDGEIRDDDGNLAAPDWDASLYFEVYDDDDVLQDTFTTSSDPVITAPEAGAVQVAGIDISGYAVGVAYYKLYADIGGENVQPYPYKEFCFEILDVPSVGYSATGDVRKKLYDVEPEEIGVAKIALAIRDAYNLINAKLNGVYTVPFSSPYPGEIVRISDGIAVVYARRYHTETPQDEEVDELQEFLNALEALGGEDLDASIPGVSRTLKADSSTRGYSSVFNVDDETSHELDPDRSESIADDRA